MFGWQTWSSSSMELSSDAGFDDVSSNSNVRLSAGNRLSPNDLSVRLIFSWTEL